MKRVSLLLSLSIGSLLAKDITLLNVSYDPTRELYAEYNEAFAKHWKEKTGDSVKVDQSHGGSGKQARAIIDGLEADVATLALAADINALHEKGGLLPEDWQKRLPHNSTPYTSTIVFLVRKGNPKGINDWNDLIKPGVEVITPNPKTSGGARWNIMAIYGSQIAEGKSPAEAQDFVKQVLANTSVQDSSARDSLNTFSSGKGDVLVGYENDAIQAKKDNIDLEYVTPDNTILIENPIAVTKDAPSEAQKFLDFLYTDQGQQNFADAGYRPVVKSVADKNASKFPTPSGLFTIAKFGGWAKVSDPFFGDNGWVIQAEKDLGNPTS